MNQIVPENIRLSKQNMFKHNGKELNGIDSERVVQTRLRQLADSNIVNKSYIGQGYYGTMTPSVIRRNVLENPKWYTPYTPYQAEIAQGRLEVMLNFQTAITSLTELDIANASLLDEATGAAEALQMSYNVHNGKRTKYFVSESTFPQTIDVMLTKCKALDLELVIGKVSDFNWNKADEFIGMLVQNPDNFGTLHDHTTLSTKLKEHKMVFTMACDLLSLAVCKSPGAMGADIAVGSA